MKIYKIAERTHGKTLREKGYYFKKGQIYRALKEGIDTIKNMDYVTLTKKWAIEHCQHMSVTEGEKYVVLSAIVNASDVAEAYNPGEYFFIGQEVKGGVVYIYSEEQNENI